MNCVCVGVGVHVCVCVCVSVSRGTWEWAKLGLISVMHFGVAVLMSHGALQVASSAIP